MKKTSSGPRLRRDSWHLDLIHDAVVLQTDRVYVKNYARRLERNAAGKGVRLDPDSWIGRNESAVSMCVNESTNVAIDVDWNRYRYVKSPRINFARFFILRIGASFNSECATVSLKASDTREG